MCICHATLLTRSSHPTSDIKKKRKREEERLEGANLAKEQTHSDTKGRPPPEKSKMQNAASSNLNMEKRFDHLKTFSSNIAGMVHELKDLIKIHEILIYKEKLSSTKKEQLQKHQDDLVALKMDLQSIKKENENMDGQLKYYKKIDESINYEIVNMSVNIQKMKLDINVQEKKKIEIKKDIDEMKNANRLLKGLCI
ncbi:hypothetical protein PVIIG_02807 [Plasmodium vivax India VII]|uniref:Uncharacterized protein n=5 Tax=Plasmodium vivax TaxID=5855 RepID=A5K6I4_PLAVS|nr:hypothetical protein, conserved [Plasmodium vivax]KMZ81380.1 hypothetical protein PVIIG_02807 [Plasmodium vivax India VII]KMZ87328.1 hypothetical protein PVBG_04037 [Plasmodium vivax Brazil I]KMZ93923.1 hypothetical protein PVMG_03090 [Plasmodium vivax Mauritania I]KNA00318.1 hypothetical protein PVNG_00952 [Plasmodium vivax North Korean]EDL44925.1 hypothetical protein, conserved [Plasmodium vivax]|eukprot:XP_001614652.1 hypothetical protein [Plasmodium vivax Sal-1]